MFSYQAFDSGTASQEEVDDLAIRLKNYHDIERFLGFEMELRTLDVYCNHPLPELTELRNIHELQSMLRKKLSDLKTYINSEVKLKTELIGKIPADPAETGTLGALIREYTTVYAVLHDSTVEYTDKSRREIQTLVDSERMKALKVIERVVALQPAVADGLKRQLNEFCTNIFVCSMPARSSLDVQLKNGPLHECGLSFENATGYIESAKVACGRAVSLFNSMFNKKMEVFMNSKIRERLEQGRKEPVIASLLLCQNVQEIGDYLKDVCLKDESIVDIINRYLKLVIVKPVKVADFKPKAATIEREQIAEVAQEFKQFLENQLDDAKADKDTITMLQIE